MRLKIVLSVFLVLFLVSSCVTFKPLKTRRVAVNGIFKADYRGNEFEGFFSVADGNLRMDVVNSFGLSVYGIFVQDGKVFIKDYQSGKTYTHLDINGINFDNYKKVLRFMAENFLTLCGTEKRFIVVLRCKKVGMYKIASDFILRAEDKRMRVHLKNIKVVEGSQ